MFWLQLRWIYRLSLQNITFIRVSQLVHYNNMMNNSKNINFLKALTFKEELSHLISLKRARNMSFEEVRNKFEGYKAQEDGDQLYAKISQYQPQQITVSILRQCVLSKFKTSLLLCYFLNLMDWMCRVVITFLISLILQQFTEGQKDKCYMLAGVLGSIWILQAIFNQCNWWCIQRTSLKIKGAITHALYLKILSTSSFTLSGTQGGQIINGIAEFHDILENQLNDVFVLFSSPLCIVVLSVLLVRQIGWIAIAGVALSILFEVIHYFYAKFNGRYYTAICKLKDERMQVLSQVVTVFRYIKMQVWEKLFMDKILKIRSDEMNELIKYGAGRSLEVSLSEGVSNASMLLIFAVAAKVSGLISTKTIVASILNIVLIKIIILYSSFGISCYFKINSLLERLTSLFSKHSKKDRPIQNEERAQLTQQEKNQQQDAIKIDGYSCSYSRDIENNAILKGVNLTIKKGEFIGVFGKVGEGKSTLLNCLAKQIPHSKGTILLPFQVAFYQSVPALFSGTIAENILLGKQMQRELYEKAIKYSCLDSDLSLMLLRDQTQVQEGGVKLSGGQRTRICLARAIYANKQILLLDDPLSSLDARVIERIMGNLKRLNVEEGKTVILVTHQIHCLIKCDWCIQISKKQFNIMTRAQLAQAQFSYLSKQQYEPSQEGNPEQFSSQEKTTATTRGIKSEISLPHPFKAEIQIPKSGFVATTLKYFLMNKWNYSVFPLTLICYTIVQSLYAFFIISLNKFDEVQAGTNNIYPNQDLFWITLGAITCAIFVFQILRRFLLNLAIQLANKTLHKKALQNIFYANIIELDKLGSKGILDKFSTDLGLLDLGVVDILAVYLNTCFVCSVQIVAIAIINPIILALVAGMLIPNFVWYQWCTNQVSILKQMDLKQKGPVIALFSETLSGLVQINNMNANHLMLGKLQQALNNSIQFGISFRKVFRVYSAYIAYFTTLIIISSYFCLIAMNQPANYTSFTFAAVFLIQINECSAWMISNAPRIHSSLVCVQRIMALSNLKKDYVQIQKKPSEQVKGITETRMCVIEKEIQQKNEYLMDLQNISLKYGEDQLFALRNINLSINTGEKIAFIGRTGSGKSSILQAFYRLVEVQPESSIFIEGKNAQHMHVSTLRQKFACIPQVPFLFSDTIRSNIDPFGKYSNQDIAKVLKQTCIYEQIAQFPDGIDTYLAQGKSLSEGQKQLICLARALLERKNILIMDQATSNIDLKTDQIIQKVIRKQFAGRTVIAVAHRLQTILDFDKIVVLVKGEIIEIGNAHQLWAKKGQFRRIIEQSGSHRHKLIQQLQQKNQ